MGIFQVTIFWIDPKHRIALSGYSVFRINPENSYTQAVLKFTKLITEAQQREAVTQGRSLPPIPATVYLKNTKYNSNTV
ncbi:MAG: hypothetical protein LBK82_17095 [Planctomycetaceae bacterium]|nr:hypothetical protein [Planctomycetaceae bacterium]